ncbi:DEAD/DEAH box helicase [Spirosoma panaciterrae]|uniref:DEAD/DEAH box helicase n=1 Tax=Spirosoma panaciterrae TaxID=496058 RepID=UPI000381604A|nr:AAA domain-containing protein [Spirosoma panaciterrae]
MLPSRSQQSKEKHNNSGTENRLSEIRVWGAYIDAQKNLLERLSQPIPVASFIYSDETLQVTLKPHDDKRDILQLLIDTLGVNPKHLRFEDGYFLMPSDHEVTAEKIEAVNKQLDNNYARIIPKPAIDGVFKPQVAYLSELIAKLLPNESDQSKRFAADGALLLTLEEIERLDKLLTNHPTISREEKIGCIYHYKVAPIANLIQSYTQEQVELQLGLGFTKKGDLLRTYQPQKVELGSYPKYLYKNEFTVEGEGVNSDLITKLENTIGLKRSEVKIRVTDKKTGNSFDKSFQDRPAQDPAQSDTKTLLNYQELGITDPLKAAAWWLRHIFPTRKRSQQYIVNFVSSTYKFEGELFKNTYRQLRVEIDERLVAGMADALSAICQHNEIHHDLEKKLLAFDITTTEDLLHRLNLISEIPNLLIDHRGSEQRLKVRLVYTTPLERLYTLIEEYLPEADFIFEPHNEIIRFFYQQNSRNVRDILNIKLRSNEWTFVESRQTALYDTYGLLYDAEKRKADDIQQYKSLANCEIEVAGKVIGEVSKAAYPLLEIELIPDIDPIESLPVVRPVFTGEYERIYRLNAVLESVQGQQSAHPKNKRVATYLFDSSKAKPIPEQIRPKEDCSEWQTMIQHLWATSLNQSQREAIFKATYAPELALIQGPPGTGKSTAIAELVWQLVRTNPRKRLLLTSEAHLAVDNAMEKLANSTHNLVKPVRFGNEEKLETEGARFAFDRMKNWVDADPLTQSESDDNILVRWHQNIQNRSQACDDIDTVDLRKRWNQVFTTDDLSVRQLLFNQYITYANVIGATSGSIGWQGSLKKPTSFFRNWLNLYPGDRSKQENPIRFDAVIIDEASKATPPELALPMLYAQKTIVVGDHRQLPPMLDEGDFIETLERVGESELATFFRQQDNQKSLFEKLFLNPNLSPTLRATFNLQYRMHPAINDVIKQFYIDDGGLLCGLNEQLVEIPQLNEPQSRYHGLSYPGLFDVNTHCVWVDVKTPEIKDKTSRINPGEVRAIRQVLRAIAKADGFATYMAHWQQPKYKPEEQEIGIISFYGSQLGQLRQMTNELSREVSELPIRLSTVDRFQGMERNIVIVSMVRSNGLATAIHQPPNVEAYPQTGYAPQSSLGFAEFPNRLNVALSRAKRLLIIVGNSDHFSRKQIYKNVYQTIADSPQGRVIDATLLPNF